MSIFGASAKIIESDSMIIQFRFPKSKKKRIRKKWAVRACNFKPDLNRVLKMGDCLICHPQTAALLRAHFSATPPRSQPH